MSNPDDNLKKKTLLPQDLVKFNVGGETFFTDWGVINGRVPNSKLAQIANSSSDKDEQGAFLIDRDPRYFKPIINFLANGIFSHDGKTTLKGVLEEARFFDIQTLIEHTEYLINQEALSLKDLPLTRCQVLAHLERVPTTNEIRLQGLDLNGANLSNLDLSHINFKYTNLSGCNLMQTNLTNCCLECTNLVNANLEGAKLILLNGLHANLEAANLRGCSFESTIFVFRTNLEGFNFKNACLEGSNLNGVNLSGANLTNANLRNCKLRGALLVGANLQDCDLSGSDIYGADLSGADVNGAIIEPTQVLDLLG